MRALSSQDGIVLSSVTEKSESDNMEYGIASSGNMKSQPESFIRVARRYIVIIGAIIIVNLHFILAVRGLCYSPVHRLCCTERVGKKLSPEDR